MWAHLDQQLNAWADRLITDVKLRPEAASKLATTIAADIRFLDPGFKSEMRAASPVPIEARLDELRAFQGWWEGSATRINSASDVRAQVVVQTYLCFVYLPESCFAILAKKAPDGSAAKQCSSYLVNGRIRSFRNAVAHANWTYNANFSGLRFWAALEWKGPLTEFEVLQDELNFWQALSRCVAYAALSNL